MAGNLTQADAKRRGRAKRFWRVANPLARPFAGWVPWWVVLETTGRRSGQVRRIPLARGPRDDRTLWLIAVHGRRAGFVRNLTAESRVRVKMAGRWRRATATVEDYDEATVARFNSYARAGPRSLGIDPVLVRLELDPDG
ncbi:MAG: hypothetical protein QOE65_114 [Solirubrobacteraceae bacterium]|nr:hypothetical protein [Solirubrobacteraceae bacterium]